MLAAGPDKTVMAKAMQVASEGVNSLGGMAGSEGLCTA